MRASKIHCCQCPHCRQEADHSGKELHQQLNLFLSSLNERQRRWFAAIESNRIGAGGDTVVEQITGVPELVIARGRTELADGLKFPVTDIESDSKPVPTSPQEISPIEALLEEMLTDEIAGDPMTQQRWVRCSLRELSLRLAQRGISLCPTTVGRLLRQRGFSLKGNRKQKKGFGSDSPHRDEQFKYIASQKQRFKEAGAAIISVDSKKKEMIGDFKRSGKTWCKEAEEVNEHDFPSLATCQAVPYGIYDVLRNKGYVYVGTSGNTPKFAVDCVARWWREEGRDGYPGVDQLLILADGGGNNGWRSHAWKWQLQTELSDVLSLSVTVCHYPTHCSKWNPVEHRLFSFISINWAGKPLRTLEVMLGYIRGTTTTTGLTVKAFLQEGLYVQGQTVSKTDMDHLILRHHSVCPDWNYTISPRPKSD